jgi:hypothetical protein
VREKDSLEIFHHVHVGRVVKTTKLWLDFNRKTVFSTKLEIRAE